MIPATTLQLLEFHKLLALIANFTNSDASRSAVKDLCPLSGVPQIETRLSEISEIRRMASEGRPLKVTFFRDLTGHLFRVRPAGSVLDAIELADFIPVFSIASDIAEQLAERDDLPRLKGLSSGLTGFPDILKTLKKSIDGEGNILDSASFLLSDLRARIRGLESKVRKKLEELMRDERLSPFLQDTFVTARSGRWVIPVRMDSKGMVPGVVHDVSKSGETAFIEPLIVINLSNELENAIADQRAEELRILREICSRIRTVIDDIIAEFDTLVYLDVLYAVSRFADLLSMETPVISETGEIRLEAARHPLLQLSLQKAGREIVPLDVSLGNRDRVMIITGANAGGKTITLKTIGLLLLMALSGMPLPAASSSRIPFLENVLVDIGDEQSIEESLSTFSAHVKNIAGILKKREGRTVILIDELGTGTDPEEGGALACAILQEMMKGDQFVFATTHLADIKSFVQRTDGMVNASMEFDQKTLTPLYTLRVGEPGQSHALEIAERYGIPAFLIRDAKGLMGTMKVELDLMIADMNRKRKEYEDALNALLKQQADLEERHKAVERMLAEGQEKQRKALAEAYRQAADLIMKTKRQMNAYLDEIKKEEKVRKRQIVKEVDEVQQEITTKLKELDLREERIPSIEEIEKEDIVYVTSLGYDVRVVEIVPRTRRVKVAARNMEIDVPLSDIRFKKGKTVTAERPSNFPEITERTLSSKISLIAMRVDEAISHLEPFLNHASLAELPEVVVIHGIGKGLLMKAVREHLTGHPLIKSFRSGTMEEGGPGVTVVRMK